MTAAMSLVTDPDDFDGIDTTAEVFRIGHPEQASWALRKVRNAEHRKAELDRILNAELDRINQWYDRATAGADRDIEFFTRLLTDYLYQRRNDDPKFKVDTPFGKVTTRRVPARVEVLDDEAFVVWARQNDRPDLLNVSVKPSLTSIKEAVLKSGEAIPGVDIVPGEERVYVTTSGDVE